MKQKNIKKNLIKNAGVVSLCTVLSRVTGLVRDMVSAHLFGLSRVWDAFVYAFMIPNLLRRIVGEGALSSAFIPVYTDILNNDGPEAARRAVHAVFSFLVTVLCLFLILTHILIRLLLFTFHFPEKIEMALGLLLILFPYIFFLSLFALCMGILHCHKRFFTSAVTPLFLNLFWIAAVVFLCPLAGDSLQNKITVLAWSVLAAGAAQFLVNFTAVKRCGISFRWKQIWGDHVLVRMLRLMAPAIVGFSITQVNIFVDLNLAMFLGDGANSALWYGNRLMQFPLGVFGIAMGTALLPTISKQASDNNIEGFKNTLSFSLRAVFLVVVPASAGLIVLREPIIRLLFERGQFLADSTVRTSSVLFCYCLGLFAYSGVKLVTSAFHSLQDTKTPVKVAGGCMVMNIVLNLILMQFFREAGLALATAVSSTMNFALLCLFLRKRIGSFSATHISLSFFKILIASILMVIVICFFQKTFTIDWIDNAVLAESVTLILSIVLGAVSYCVFALCLGVHEMRRSFSYFLKRIFAPNA